MLPRVTQCAIASSQTWVKPSWLSSLSRVNKYLCMYSGEVTQQQLPEENDSRLWRLELLGRNTTQVRLLWKASLLSQAQGKALSPLSSYYQAPEVYGLVFHASLLLLSRLEKAIKARKALTNQSELLGLGGTELCDSRTAGSGSRSLTQ